jgi:hypothetical protein
MANEKKKQPKSWQGDEVARRPDAEAENAAQRAEGNGPIDVAEALRSDESAANADQTSPPRRRSGDDEEAKIAEAAEAHRARRASGDGPPRKTL